MTRLTRLVPSILAGLLLSAQARADNTPIVHGIPTAPLTAVRALAGGLQIMLDAAPPASAQFYFDVPVPDANAVGVLEIWPEAEDQMHGRLPKDPNGRPTCTRPPNEGRQVYRLGMGTAKEGDSTYFLRATVPPLQVGQRFCFSVTPRLAPSTAEMSVIAAKMTPNIIAAVPDHNGQCSIDDASFADWLGQELGLDPKKLAHKAIIAQLAPGAGNLKAAFVSSVLGPCTDYQTAIDSFNAALDARKAHPGDSNAQAAEKAASMALTTKQQAFQAAVPGIFTEAVRTSLVVSVMNIDLNSIAGYGTTPTAANFGSVDAGAFVAFPSGGSQSGTDIWLVPYLGLNLYTTPVDRTIDLDQLTGSWLDRVRQRVSLTIGVTLSAPSIAGRTLNAPFLSRYPVIALGVRTSSYSRVTAGAVIYDIVDANPASGTHVLAAAPFVGVALDIDLIHLLTQAKL
jgi:hypothetical protein